MSILLEYKDIKDIIAASQEAFLTTGKYILTKRQAYEQFGKTKIQMLIDNKLLEDTRMKKIAKTKCRFLLSDIITGLKLWEKKSNPNSQ